MELQIGDIVQLKSGGPAMTVTDVEEIVTKVIYWHPVRGEYTRFEFESGLLAKV